MQDYESLLKQAMAQLPEKDHDGQRWSIPPAEVIREGRMTILRNFREMLTEFRREDEHLGKYLLQSLATAGQIDGDRVIFTGKITEAQVNSRIRDYVATFVQCIECGSPDTHLGKDGRVQMLNCDACGARTPVKARKAVARMEKNTIRDGATLELTIEKIGPKGEGMTEIDGFTVVVPKTAVGKKVQVKIIRISGRLAFAETITPS